MWTIRPSRSRKCSLSSALGRDNANTMIHEHALLRIAGGREVQFEQAFREAAPIISSAPGFQRLRLERCVEDQSRYLLLVEWEHMEDHTEGFRRSPEYQQWKGLLHHFYDPFPTVEHYEPVLTR